MTFRTWLQDLRDCLVPGGHRRGTCTATARLDLESLNDRITPSFGYGGQFSLPNGEVATADFNDDGNLDLVSANPLQVLLGDGQGGATPPSDFAYGGVFVRGDFTGDGIPDEVSATLSWGVYLWPGIGGGAYGNPVLTDIMPANCLAAADFNGDGRLDVVSVTATMDFGGQGSAWLGRGDGTFTLSGDYFGLGLEVPQAIATGDFSGDGRPDVSIQGLGYDGLDAVTVLINAADWTPPPPPPPLRSISISDRTLTEGNAGSVAATFTVTLSAASTQTITVAYATANGTATAGSDYQTTTGTLTFAPGQTSKTVTVPVTGDLLGEPNETFVVNLSAPYNATIADGRGVGTIVDDEPRVSIGDVTKKEGNGKTTAFTFTVTLSAAYDQPVTIRYATADGTATTGDGDYVAKTGTITFAPGETSKTITITVNCDRKQESNETFYIHLFDDSGTSWFTKNRGIGTITNDD
jgi:hypothetical protein